MIHTRSTTALLQLRDDGDGRTLVGPVLPWGVEARVVDRGRLVTETFERGALAGTDPARVPLTATHPRDAGTLPIGVTLAIDDRADAAWGEWHVSDTMIGNEVLALARDPATLPQLPPSHLLRRPLPDMRPPDPSTSSQAQATPWPRVASSAA
jgi:hypothetical protein